MGQEFLKPCSKYRCKNTVRGGGYCPEHAESKPPPLPDQRPSAARRGYGPRWKKYRLWFLNQGDNQICAHCGRTPFKQDLHVDHIEPVTGPDDPLFWKIDNHQALCGPCHSRKTPLDVARLAERRRKMKVTVGVEAIRDDGRCCQVGRALTGALPGRLIRGSVSGDPPGQDLRLSERSRPRVGSGPEGSGCGRAKVFLAEDAPGATIGRTRRMTASVDKRSRSERQRRRTVGP